MVISICCKSHVHVISCKQSVNYYSCDKCNRPCDTMSQSRLNAMEKYSHDDARDEFKAKTLCC
jgi:hypothetical protein